MRALSSPALILATLVLGLAGTSHADDVYLKSGSKLEGKATRDGDAVTVETRHGSLRLRADEVDRIVPGKTRHERYDERKAKVTADDADAQMKLGEWCRDEGLKVEARRHFRKVIEIAPEHTGAHKRLGHIEYEGKWLTSDEYRRARGFVKVDGKWVSRDDQRRLDAQARRDAETNSHLTKIKNCVKRMSSKKRAKRLAAKLELQEYAESRGDFKLAAFASQVAEYYNGQWRVIRNSANVKTTVRATSATLKRPIPTISTSLGAFSTPVRIQLPELAVASVKTTVVIPAGIELDED